MKKEMNKKLKYLPKSNRSQQILGMSFGTIFSILLIIFFIVIGFIVINSVLSWKKCSQVGLFIGDTEGNNGLRGEVNKAWNSQSLDEPYIGTLPSDITIVCFGDLSKSITASGNYRKVGEELKDRFSGSVDNMFFYPLNKACDFEKVKVNHLDMDNIIQNENPFCFPVEKGKVTIQVQKDLGEGLVKVKRQSNGQ